MFSQEALQCLNGQILKSSYEQLIYLGFYTWWGGDFLRLTCRLL
jgi:hypothetical protein